MTCDVGNPSLGLGQAHKCGRVTHVIVCSVSLVRLIIVHFVDIGGIDVQHKKHTLCKGPAKEL
jgi:hypothetical protein